MLNLSDLRILRGCFLFENLQSNELFKLNDFLKTEKCTVISFQKDDSLFDDENTYQLGILLSGKVTAVCSEENKSALRTFSQGEMFGAAGIFCSNAKKTLPKLKADSNCRILLLGRDCVEKIIRSNADIAVKYIEFLSNRVEFLNNRISTFTSSQAVKRLAKFILEKSQTNLEDLNFAALARSLDISRASLYRAKSELEECGAVQFEMKKITILDMDGLKSYLE